ncbi:hypothetical protein [Gimesia sp.]|uniref:hypothetical protein n=1 Tax=Gimesia sp. TaxID=2024833 RepID=UPI0032EC506B
MVKLNDDPIQADDIKDFVNNTSDFGFELNILSKLTSLNIECQHSGSYSDPVTNKPRQFDIRSRMTRMKYTVKMAIECKNLRSNFPLLIMRIPRTENESFHEVIHSHRIDHGSPGRRLRIKGYHSLYSVGDYVGKSCSQVGRTTQNKDITGNDAEVYDKWSQAIHSSYDLVNDSCDDWRATTTKNSYTLVLPVLVVPNNRLWIMDYSSDGKPQGDPREVDRASIFIDQMIKTRKKAFGLSATISHLEVMTEIGLFQFCESFFDGNLINKVFSEDGLEFAQLLES